MSTFIYVLISLVVVIDLVGAIIVVAKAKKAGQPIPWDKVRPIATEAFSEVQKLIVANKMGLQEVEDFVVSFILNRVDVADHIGSTEKAILSEGLIRSIVAPSLAELHDKLTTAPASSEQK